MGPQGPPGRPPSPKMAATPRVSMVMEPENPAVPGFAMRYASFDDAVSFLINCFRESTCNFQSRAALICSLLLPRTGRENFEVSSFWSFPCVRLLLAVITWAVVL